MRLLSPLPLSPLDNQGINLHGKQRVFVGLSSCPINKQRSEPVRSSASSTDTITPDLLWVLTLPDQLLSPGPSDLSRILRLGFSHADNLPTLPCDWRINKRGPVGSQMSSHSRLWGICIFGLCLLLFCTSIIQGLNADLWGGFSLPESNFAPWIRCVGGM